MLWSKGFYSVLLQLIIKMEEEQTVDLIVKDKKELPNGCFDWLPNSEMNFDYFVWVDYRAETGEHTEMRIQITPEQYRNAEIGHSMSFNSALCERFMDVYRIAGLAEKMFEEEQ